MDTHGFFTRVCPSIGNIVICALNGPTGKFWNAANCATVAEAVAQSARLDAKADLTVYFSVGTHASNEEQLPTGRVKIIRKQVTAHAFKALALDLDCGPGKPYATQKDGMQALIMALNAIGFPVPMVVNSGNGVHCYWPLTKEVTPDEWVAASTALRYALRDHNVQIDESKIHDTSMVLRPVGTHHKKQQPWKEVKLVWDSPDYEYGNLLSHLAKWVGKAPAKSAAPTKKAMSATAAAVLTGGYDPLKLDLLAAKCNQIGSLIASGGVTDAAGNPVSEPLWRASLGVAMYCDDVPAAVTALAGQYPNFDLQENLDKIAGWKGTGVTTCAQFEQHCPAGCNGCTYKGTIKSPAAHNIATVLTVAAADPLGDAMVLPPMELPPGYFAAHGKVWTEVEREKFVKGEDGDKVAVKETERVLVSEYPIVILDRFTSSHTRDRSTLTWAAKFPIVGWKVYDMPMDVLSTGGVEFKKYLGNKQIYISSDGMLKRLSTYMHDFLKFQQNRRDTGMDMESFGWQPAGGFLFGDNLIGRDGHQAKWRPARALKALSNRIGTTGDRAKWVALTKELDQDSGRFIAFATMVAGSGLLLPGSGIPSFVYSLYSDETGTGKTFSLLFGNSTFGHPSKNLLAPNDTENALYQIMGSMGSLSAAMDEITTMGIERAAQFAFQAQTGREKHRLNSNAELREGVQWHAPLRVSTNKSLFNMYDNVKVRNEAEKVRTLEVMADDKSFVRTHDVQEFVRILIDNHGFAVPEVAAEIIKQGGVRTVYDRYRDQFKAQFPTFDFVGDERFYAGGVISTYGFGCLARDLGVLAFDVEGSVEPVLAHIVNLRTERQTYRHDCFDSIGQFLSDSNKRLISVKVDPTGKQLVQMPIPDDAAVRVEVVGTSANPVMPGSKMMISVSALRQWTKNSGEDYKAIVDRLRNEGALLNPRERVTMFKGTHHNNPGQAFCVVLDLTHPRFASVIASDKALASTNPALALLQGGKP